MLLYLKRYFAALNLSIFLLLYKTFIGPHLEYSIQATHPILGRDAEALEKVQKVNLKFVKGLRHVPYEAAHKQLRLFSLTHRLIRGDIITKITHGLLKFLMASSFVYPTSRGLRGHAFKFHQRYALSPIRLHHSGCSILEKLPAEIVNAFLVKSPGCPLAVTVPRCTHLTHLLPKPHPQHTATHAKTHTTPWSFIVDITASETRINLSASQ